MLAACAGLLPLAGFFFLGQVVVVFVWSELSAVNASPVLVEIPVTLGRQINLTTVDLACLDVDMTMSVLGVLVYSDKGPGVREVPFNPLLGQVASSFRVHTTLKACNRPEVSSYLWGVFGSAVGFGP